MTEDKYKRFRHLERPRQPGGPDPREARPGTGERFEALEERRAPGASPGGPGGVASGHLDRFRPAAERPIETAAVPEGELPFVRCASCQMDHNRTAVYCANCGADLRTDEQRGFNARLATERRGQAAVEQSQSSELERARREAEGDAARAKREMGETLAREVGRAERRRLDAEGLGGFGDASRGGWGGGWGDGGHGWRRVAGIVGWILLAVLRFIFRARIRRW